MTGTRSPGRAGRGAPRPALVALATAVLAAGSAGCASGGSAFHRHFEAGRLEAAEAAFRRDSSLRRDGRSVYRAALVYALPGSPARDPARGRELLRSYLEAWPEGSRTVEARSLLALLEEMERLRSRVAGLQEQLERLKEIDLERAPSDSSGGPGPDPP